MSNKSIYFIILTWNNYEDTRECIESALKVNQPDFKLLLVDNASDDGSFQKITQEFPHIETLVLEENRGVSGGYNAGLKYAFDKGADYIVLSNNDIVFANDFLSELITLIEKNKNIGIAVPKTFNYYKTTWLAGIGGRWRRFPPSVKMIGVNTPDSKHFNAELELEYAISACFLVTKELINDIGYFDTGYYFYNDDWDFSIRARNAGYLIKLQPTAHIWHKVSISTQKSEKKEIWWNYFGRSTYRFYKKNRSTIELYLYIIWFVVRETLKRKFSRIQPFLTGVIHERNLTTQRAKE
jgi:GT2 family glycosyltransferase